MAAALLRGAFNAITPALYLKGVLFITKVPGAGNARILGQVRHL